MRKHVDTKREWENIPKGSTNQSQHKSPVHEITIPPVYKIMCKLWNTALQDWSDESVKYFPETPEMPSTTWQWGGGGVEREKKKKKEKEKKEEQKQGEEEFHKQTKIPG